VLNSFFDVREGGVIAALSILFRLSPNNFLEIYQKICPEGLTIGVAGVII
jgi:hypothetical protein